MLVDLSNINDKVKNEVVKQTVYNELVSKINVIQTTDNNNLVKKANYNTEIDEVEKKILAHNHCKYITAQEFNNLTAENFTARLKQKCLGTKVDIDCFIKKTEFDD